MVEPASPVPGPRPGQQAGKAGTRSGIPGNPESSGGGNPTATSVAEAGAPRPANDAETRDTAAGRRPSDSSGGQPAPGAGTGERAPEADAVRPAADAVRRLVMRVAVALRLTCTAVVAVVVAISPPPSGGGGLVLAVVAVLVAWSVVFAVVLVRHSAARWPVAVDVGLATAICVLESRLLPGETVAEGSSWAATVATVAVVAANLAYPLRSGIIASLLVAGGWAVGSTLGAGAGSGLSFLVMLLIQAGVTAVLMHLVRRAASTADEALDKREEALRAAAVEAARRVDERALRRRLHDTVLATLTTVGSGAIATDSPTLRARAAEDLGVLADLAVIQPVDGPAVRLDQRLTRVADRISPLLEVTTSLVPCAVPGDVADAIAGAVNEALVNVAKHAEADAVTMRLRLVDGVIEVEVADGGIGFDPAAVARHHLGLRESVIGRMRDVGGWARVRSGLGKGCTVTLGWRQTRRGERRGLALANEVWRQ